MENFLAIGAEELGAEVKKGEKVAKGGLMGNVEYGIDSITGKESNLLGFVTGKNGKSYLVAVSGKLLEGWEKVND